MTSNINYKLLSQEIIKNIRRKYSQQYLNQKLGYASNQMYRWESGGAHITWSEFFSLCNIAKIKLEDIFKSYFRYDLRDDDIVKFLKYLIGKESVSLISDKTGISISKIRRIFNSKSSLRLYDFFKIIFSYDKMESIGLVSELSGEFELKTLKDEIEFMDVIKKEYFRNPSFGLFLISLELNKYKDLKNHSDKVLSKLSGLSEKEIRIFSKKAIRSGFIKYQNNKLEIKPFHINDRGTKDEMISVRKYWSQKAQSAMDKKIDSNAFGSLVFSTSKKAQEKIISEYLRFFEQVKLIVNEDQSSKELPLVMNFHLFSTNN